MWTLVIETQYVHSWLAGGAACVFGVVFSLMTVHDSYGVLLRKHDSCDNNVIDEVFFIDAVAILTFAIILVYGYDQEKADRIDFYSYRKQSEAHKLYKRLLSQIPAGIVILDSERRVRFANNRVLEILPRRSLLIDNPSPGVPMEMVSRESLAQDCLVRDSISAIRKVHYTDSVLLRGELVE